MNNTRSINQLQRRIFVVIALLFAAIVVGYRVFIEHPKVQQAISNTITQEMAALKLAAKKQLSTIATVNYDYAVWDATYNFIRIPNPQYLNENLIDDTFISLKIDGMIFIDEYFRVIYEKGFHHNTTEPLAFEFYNFNRYPENKKIAPNKGANQKVGVNSGVINSKYGPVIFSSTEIKKSDQSGEPRGFLVFIQLIDQELINQIAEFTFTKITLKTVPQPAPDARISDWFDLETITAIEPVSQKYINDLHHKPVALLVVEHANGIFPPWLDTRSLVFIFIFIVLLVIVYLLFSCKIGRPIKDLALQIKNMGSQEELVKLSELNHIKELSDIARYFNMLVRKVHDQKALLNQQVYLDPLTNIANRRAFDLHIEKQIQLYQRHDIGFTVLFADIDYFKRYNDSLGHIAGDKALTMVAQHLSGFFNRANDFCARFGGEEFVMLFSNIQPEQLELQLTPIINSFKQLNIPHPDSPTAPYVTISIGACNVISYGEKPKELSIRAIFHAADMVLYEAKHRGRNQYCVADFIP